MITGDISGAIDKLKKTIKKSNGDTCEEQQKLLEFLSILQNYTPDWNIICSKKLFKDTKDILDDDERKRDFLAKRLRNQRIYWKYSYRRMGEICQRSHAYIYSIEMKKAKNPFKSIETLAYHLKSSVPYLIGLYDEPGLQPTIVDVYLWDEPSSPYKEYADKAKEISGMNNSITPIMIEPRHLKMLKEELCKLVDRDHRLADIIIKIFKKHPNKRRSFVTILEELSKL